MFHISLAENDDLGGAIYRQIRRGVVDGVLRPGDRLPASRELARTLVVARATVVTAYERLTAEGFLQSRQGAGTFVNTWSKPDARKSDERERQQALQPRSIWNAISLPTAFDAEARYDFRTGLPDASLFPHRQWRRLVNRALRIAEINPQGKYDTPAGHPRLRSAIARHIGVSRGITASEDDLVITSGTQQAIDLVSRVLLEPGDRVAVETPGYEATRRSFEAAGADVVGVPVDDEGIVVEAIPRDVRAIYVTPSHQYPMTVTMSMSRRRALLDWADLHGAAIIEDDYDGEFRFEGRPLEALQTLDSHGRVIYVGSFSKTLLPALRLGFVLVPPTLRTAIRKAKYVSNWHGPLLEQSVLAEYIESGSFARHVRRLSGAYRARHRLIAEIIRRDFLDHLELVPSHTGLTLTALAKSANVQQLAVTASRAAALGVEINQLSSFEFGRPPQAGIVLGCGGIAVADIEPGLQLLRRCFD
ncbi:MAG TPA: PLP-dependent aminotransferase family protein [Devosia sp.]|jgi:GntR family transcriptional regulator/MocR family aminotransferase|uniref:MocR-like pyridoxine biosynthesis transcription factor PdxR n=1 Tax=Devosia sp. TaxID=1871048 RepID=UPI002DDCB627|nr:PLP-dependent aminotransferase family protein [Devosia sp.]HEV2515690.1 PLP-dependent aminotransferase family protein [Devosia sp.]